MEILLPSNSPKDSEQKRNKWSVKVEENLTIETIWFLLRGLSIALHFIWKSLSLSLSLSLPCLKMNILHVGLHNGSSALTILLFMWFWLTAASVAAQTPHHLAANVLLLPDTDVSMSILKLAHFGPVWVSFSRLVQSVIVMVHVILHPLGTCNWKKNFFFSKRRKWMRKK